MIGTTGLWSCTTNTCVCGCLKGRRGSLYNVHRKCSWCSIFLFVTSCHVHDWSVRSCRGHAESILSSQLGEWINLFFFLSFFLTYLNVLSVLLVKVAIVFAMHICLDSYFRIITRVVPKVMSNFFFLHANWEQQTKESAVVDGTSCCVILECLVTSIACIT